MVLNYNAIHTSFRNICVQMNIVADEWIILLVMSITNITLYVVINNINKFTIVFIQWIVCFDSNKPNETYLCFIFLIIMPVFDLV